MSQFESRRVPVLKASRSSVSRRQPTSARKSSAPPQPLIAAPALPVDVQRQQLIFGGVMLATGVWAYWPTLVSIVSSWNQIADYSHGYFVVPAAIYFLWARRHDRPAISS